MKCAACAVPLLAGESVPALAGKLVQVSCPRCRSKLVASFDSTGDVVILPTLDAYRRARTTVLSAYLVDRVIAVITVFGCIVGSTGMALLSGGSVQVFIFYFVLFGLIGGTVIGGLYLDIWIGARRWLRSLPEAAVVFVVPPDGYRK